MLGHSGATPPGQAKVGSEPTPAGLCRLCRSGRVFAMKRPKATRPGRRPRPPHWLPATRQHRPAARPTQVLPAGPRAPRGSPAPLCFEWLQMRVVQAAMCGPTGVGVARLGWGGAGLTPRLTAPPPAAPRLPPPRGPRAEARCHPWARHREATAKPFRGAACAGRVSTAPRAGARAVVTVTTGPVAPVMRSRKSGGDPPRARPGAWGPVLWGASGAGSLG